MTETSSYLCIKLENEEHPLLYSNNSPVDIKEEIEIGKTVLLDIHSYVVNGESSLIVKTEKSEEDLETVEYCKEEFQEGEFVEQYDGSVEDHDFTYAKTPDEEDSDKLSDAQNHAESGTDMNEVTSKPKRIRPKKYICQHCDHSTAFPSTLKRHITAIHLKLKEHKCEHCDYSASRPHIIRQHIETVHQKIRNHKCEHCDYSTSLKQNLKVHINSVHLKIKNYKCEHCDHRASARSSIKSHMNIVHPEIKDNECEECDCSSTTNHDMNCIHSKNEYHECEYCDYRTIYLPYLKRHSKNVHLSKNEKKQYKCEYCNYTTVWRYSFKLHVNTIHLGIRKHECKLCDYKASTRSNLKNHIHSNHFIETPTNHKCGLLCQCTI